MKALYKLIKKKSGSSERTSPASENTLRGSSSFSNSREYLVLQNIYTKNAVEDIVNKIDPNLNLANPNACIILNSNHPNSYLLSGYIALYAYINFLPVVDHHEGKSILEQIQEAVDKYCFEINKILPLKETQLKYFTNVIINQLNIHKANNLIDGIQIFKIVEYVNLKVADLMAFKFIQLQPEDINANKKLKVLGGGSQGEVELYRIDNADLLKDLQSRKVISSGSNEVAIKKLNANMLDDQQAIKEFNNECAVIVLLWKESYMLEKKKPNSCRYNLAIPALDNLILTHVESEGDSATYIARLSKALLRDTSKINCAVHQLCAIIMDAHRGISQIHNANIIHRDIWSRNILIHRPNDKKIIARIADFGKAIIKKEVKKPNEELKETSSKTQLVRMPSRSALGAVSIATDIYSFKIVILEFITKLAGINFTAIINQCIQVNLSPDQNPNKIDEIANRDEEKLRMIAALITTQLEQYDHPLQEVIKNMIAIFTQHNIFDWDAAQTASENSQHFKTNLMKAIRAIKSAYPLNEDSYMFDLDESVVLSESLANEYQITQDTADLNNAMDVRVESQENKELDPNSQPLRMKP